MEKQFPSVGIVDSCFGIFGQQHATEHELNKTVMQKLHSLLSFTENNEAISVDNTLAESEWLVLSNEFIANHSDGKRNSCQSEMVRIFNNELYLMLGKFATFGLILPVNTAAFEWGLAS